MRKINVGLFMSLDGVVQAPGYGDVDKFEHSGWSMPYFSDDIVAFMGSSAATSDALLLGRITYQTFEASFAPQKGGMADVLNNKRKYVVSTTMEQANWNNSTLIRDDIPQEVARLKQEQGQDISISGSITLVQMLLQHNLIDELGVLVYPIVLGTGRRLFPDGFAKTALQLIEAKPLSKGVVLLRYQPEAQA